LTLLATGWTFGFVSAPPGASTAGTPGETVRTASPPTVTITATPDHSMNRDERTI
jgi:hypothetical protein